MSFPQFWRSKTQPTSIIHSIRKLLVCALYHAIKASSTRILSHLDWSCTRHLSLQLMDCLWELWSLLKSKKCEATIQVQVPKQKHRNARTALCEVKFSDFIMNRPHNYCEGKVKNPPDLNVYAVFISEIECPKDNEPIA